MPPPTLIDSYETPPFHYGDSVFCEFRGEVIITGLSTAPIPWPIAKKPGGRARGLVVYARLVDRRIGRCLAEPNETAWPHRCGQVLI
jgi:hypothetical protein